MHFLFILSQISSDKTPVGSPLALPRGGLRPKTLNLGHSKSKIITKLAGREKWSFYLIIMIAIKNCNIYIFEQSIYFKKELIWNLDLRFERSSPNERMCELYFYLAL